MAAGWDELARKLAETALHAVADDGIADLLANRIADALQRISVLAVTDEEDKARRRRAPTGVRSEKIRALAEDG
jgi:hypothetical protein